MLGETSRASPTSFVSGQKAAFGALSAALLVVIQPDSTPLPSVDQPTGSAGAVTESKFWVKTPLGVPTGKRKLTVPRFTAPLCNWRVARMLLPHEASARKERTLVFVVPPAVIVPKLCATLGDVTPPVASNVATTLVAFWPPMFNKENWTAACSKGSTTLLIGLQLSLTTTALLAMTWEPTRTSPHHVPQSERPLIGVAEYS